MLTIEDKLAIHDLISLYGHIIDERQFTRTHELFTEDAVYDVTDFNAGRFVGWQQIAQMWRESEGKHPLAHHATNVYISEDADGTVRVVSKGIGVRPNLQAGSVTYRDIVVNTPQGWRVRERICVLRRADRIPPHS
jgi:3-phenylpropionate/cinnamic acid dioxygenase small subunit